MKFREFVVSQRDTLCRGSPTPRYRRSLRLTPCITKVFSYPELAQNFVKVNTLGEDSCTTPEHNRVWLHDREMVFVPNCISLYKTLLRLAPCITKVFSYPELVQNSVKPNTLGGDSCTTCLSLRTRNRLFFRIF